MDIDVDTLLGKIFSNYDEYEILDEDTVYVCSVVLADGTEYDGAKVNFNELTVTCITEKVFNLNLSLTPDA